MLLVGISSHFFVVVFLEILIFPKHRFYLSKQQKPEETRSCTSPVNHTGPTVNKEGMAKYSCVSRLPLYTGRDFSPLGSKSILSPVQFSMSVKRMKEQANGKPKLKLFWVDLKKIQFGCQFESVL